jgi:hypothetical protein
MRIRHALLIVAKSEEAVDRWWSCVNEPKRTGQGAAELFTNTIEDYQFP